MKSFFKLVWFYIIDKPIKLDVLGELGSYCVTDVNISINRDSEIVKITLESIDDVKRKNII